MTGINTNFLLNIRTADPVRVRRFYTRLAGFLDEQAKAGLIQDHRLGELTAVTGEGEQPATRLMLREESYGPFAV